MRPGLSSGVVNICTGHATSINGLWHLLARDRHRTLAPSHARPRAGDIHHSWGLPTAARDALEFQAEVALADGLAALVGD